MKAAEVLRLYKAGVRDFRGVNLRGQNFKVKDPSGADLSKANFSGADIRGTNFSNTNLTKANFAYAKTGALLHWRIISTVIILFLLGVSSIIFILLWVVVACFLTALVGALFGFLVSALLRTSGGVGEGTLTGALYGVCVGLLVAVFTYLVFSIKIHRKFSRESRKILRGTGNDSWEEVINKIITRIIIKGFNTQNRWVFRIISLLRIVYSVGGTSFFKANLEEATFLEAKIKLGTNFRQAVLLRTYWSDAKGLLAVLPGETYLKDPSIAALVCTRHGANQTYNYNPTLEGLNLKGAYLVGSSFSCSNLNFANLQNTNLSNAQLVQTQLDQADLTGATLTGACIEDWNVNASTKLADVTCDYVYLKSNRRERRPSQGTFQPGEFAALFQQAVNTVDLIFKDGIDWQAFFQSFQDLRSQYADQDLSIQAIEKKQDGAFVVRLEVPENADKPAIESSAKELYETKLALMEQRYRAELNAKDGEIVAYREQSANLMKITEMLAARPPMSETPKYDLRGAQFAGGFAETVEGDQVGGTINNQAAETPSLAEAAAEIQNLLKQLEASNPTATEADQTAFLNVMIPPTKRERFIGALKAGSGAAIEEIPYGAVLKALVEGWQRPGG